MELLIDSKELKELKTFITRFHRQKTFRVIRMLHKHPEGLTATAILDKIDISQPEVNTALRFLLKHGFATTERRGKFIIYTPVYEKFDALLEMYTLFIATQSEQS